MMFAMARDNRLPFSHALARVDERSGAPIAPSIVVGVLATLILLVNIGQGAIVAALTSMAVALGYIAYLIVTATLLKRRLGGWPTDRTEARQAGYFTMGRTVGLVVNVAAVLYGIVCIVNVTWPRTEIYNAIGPAHWYLQYFAYLFTAILVVLGVVLYALSPRGRSDGIVQAPREVPCAPASRCLDMPARTLTADEYCSSATIPHADVLFVGAGPSGATVAKHLSEWGFDIVCLEQGPWINTDDYTENCAMGRPAWLIPALGVRPRTGELKHGHHVSDASEHTLIERCVK